MVYGVSSTAGNQDGWNWKQAVYDGVTYYAGSGAFGAASGGANTALTAGRAAAGGVASALTRTATDAVFYKFSGGDVGQEFTWKNTLTSVATSAATAYLSNEIGKYGGDEWYNQAVRELASQTTNGFVSDTIRRNTFGGYDAQQETGMNFLQRTLSSTATFVVDGVEWLVIKEGGVVTSSYPAGSK